MYYSILPTELLYMTDKSTKFDNSEVVDILTNPDGRKVLVLDQTIFYPQGGGQPYDIGTIETVNGVFEVQEVRFIEGLVHHIGNFTKGAIEVGEKVTSQVDESRRILNCKLHSSGHLIDIALRNVGYKDITPSKGYHFPDGPYVEYLGDITDESIVEKLQKELDRLISVGYEVLTKMSSLEEAKQVCYFLHRYFPEGKPIRIVSIWNNEYIPCGGIHVSNISELKGLTIKEIKSKKGNTRVSYLVQ